MRRALVLAALMASPLLAAKPPLTVERLFADPPLEGAQPQEIAWLPDGTHLSYLIRSWEGGKSSTTLWLVDATRADAKAVLSDAELATESTEAATQVHPTLAGYRWSPDGSTLLLEGGGDLFLYHRADGKTERLTDTPAKEELATFSPDGTRIAFVRNNDLYVLELASKSEVRVTEDGSADRLNGKLDWVYTEEIAERSPLAYAWSPTGDGLAFLSLDDRRVPSFPQVGLLSDHPTVESQRYPQPGDPNPAVTLTVVALPSGATTVTGRQILSWNDPQDEYLPRFGWLPGGKGVWYELLNRDQTRLEVAALDLATRKPRTLLVEEDPAWVDVTDDLRFLADGSFLWSSQRSGYRHLYHYDAMGKEVRQLTKGRWEVSHLDAVDEHAGWVYFTATEASVLTHNLYKVRLDGLGFRRVTFGAGSHRVDVAPAGRFVVDSYSELAKPAAVRILDGDGRVLQELAGSTRPELDKFELSTPQLVKIAGNGETALYASVLKPPDFDSSKQYPAIVYAYGGPGVQLVRNAWPGRYGLVSQVLAAHGFVVLTVDGRGTPGRGRDFEHAVLRRFGKVELEGQLAGVRWFRNQPWSDRDHIGIWGASYGGFMTCYALLHAPDVFSAGVAIAPVTDWRLYDSIYTERYLKQPKDNPDGYRESSLVDQADRLKGALLLIHGTADDNVHVNNTLIFADRLVRAGKPYELQLYGRATHRVYRPDQRLDEMKRLLAFFARALKR
ncbi:MAG: DPP IV N-terminal domain-containing protein [Acidobacteriota bacterium]